MRNEIVFKKNPSMVTRTIDKETILMPIYKSSDEINCIYTLNKSASRLWQVIDGKNTIGSIKKKILNEFDINEKELDKEIDELLKDLIKIKAVLVKKNDHK